MPHALTAIAATASIACWVPSAGAQATTVTFDPVGAVQSLQITATGNYLVEASGAQGGADSSTYGHSGGLGARVRGVVPLAAGDTLCIVVGMRPQGPAGPYDAGGGGGGSFVFKSDASCSTLPALPLMAAGGGGGGDGSGGQATPNGADGAAPGGLNGAGGGAYASGLSQYHSGGGGAGWLGAGQQGSPATFAGGGGHWAGGAGASYLGTLSSAGGFGGGGGAGMVCNAGCGSGGGGGYSGGGGGAQVLEMDAGGGGSYNGGVSDRTTTAAVQAGHGVVAITLAGAATGPPPMTLREVASGFFHPTEIANAGDGSGRLFIVEKAGVIRVVRDGAVLPAPFLDVTSQVSSPDERGLLGLAFHPRYASNRRFFVYYTELGSGALRVSSFLAGTGNPDVADPASERLIVSVPHPTFTNHNGGRLAFGPDGYLYIGMGDGGSSGDPPNNAQSLSTLLGKLLRVDIDTPEGYSIPPDNPFVGVAGARGEIWAYGLRNPWKFSFDRVTGDLYIGDVGQNRIEEIDFVPYGTAPGINFGWRVFEGADCFNPSAGCALSGHRPPIIQYAHDAAGGESVTGGYAYRGYRSAALRGYYFYGDFISSRVWAAVREGTSWRTSVVFEPPGPLSGVSTFGEDEAGEILVASYNDGRVYAIQGLAPGVNPVNRFEYNSAGQPIRNPWHRRMR